MVFPENVTLQSFHPLLRPYASSGSEVALSQGRHCQSLLFVQCKVIWEWGAFLTARGGLQHIAIKMQMLYVSESPVSFMQMSVWGIP